MGRLDPGRDTEVPMCKARRHMTPVIAVIVFVGLERRMPVSTPASQGGSSGEKCWQVFVVAGPYGLWRPMPGSAVQADNRIEEIRHAGKIREFPFCRSAHNVPR